MFELIFLWPFLLGAFQDAGTCSVTVHDDPVVSWQGTVTARSMEVYECVADEGRVVIAFGGLNFYPAPRLYEIRRHGPVRLGVFVRVSNGRIAGPAEDGHVRILESRDRTIKGEFAVSVHGRDGTSLKVTATFHVEDHRHRISPP